MDLDLDEAAWGATRTRAFEAWKACKAWSHDGHHLHTHATSRLFVVIGTHGRYVFVSRFGSSCVAALHEAGRTAFSIHGIVELRLAGWVGEGYLHMLAEFYITPQLPAVSLPDSDGMI